MFFFTVVYCRNCHFHLDTDRRIIIYNSSNPKLGCGSRWICSCIITAQPKTHIHLEISLFQLLDVLIESSRKADWLYLYDGNSSQDTLLGKFTGTKESLIVQSSGRFMKIELIRDLFYSHSIFKGSYYYSTTKGKLIFILVSLPFLVAKFVRQPDITYTLKFPIGHTWFSKTLLFIISVTVRRVRSKYVRRSPLFVVLMRNSAVISGSEPRPTLTKFTNQGA